MGDTFLINITGNPNKTENHRQIRIIVHMGMVFIEPESTIMGKMGETIYLQSVSPANAGIEPVVYSNLERTKTHGGNND